MNLIQYSEGTISRFRKSRDARALTSNFISLSALRVLGYLFPLITLPYLARVIGVDMFGELAFAASVVVYFQTFVDFGFNYTAVRDIARIRDDENAVSEIFCSVMVAKTLLMLFSFILLSVLIAFVPFFRDHGKLLLLTFLYIPGYVLFPEWFFQAVEKMKYITILNLIAKLLFTFMVFVFIRKKSDYLLQPLLTAAGFFVSGMLSMWIIIRKFRIKPVIPGIKAIWKTTRESWNMFLSLFLPNLYTNFSVILLEAFSGMGATGIYSGGYKFIELSDQLSSVLSRTFYPFLARRLDRHRLYVMISLTISILTGAVLFAGAGLLVKLFYTAEFSDSVLVIRVMAVTPLFLFLMGSYGPNYLVLIGREKILRNIIVICSLGGFLLAWIVVPRFSYVGVAATITVVWGIRGTLTWYYAQRCKRKNMGQKSAEV